MKNGWAAMKLLIRYLICNSNPIHSMYYLLNGNLQQYKITMDLLSGYFTLMERQNGMD